MARLTRIYTRTGDTGTTALANGTRVAKSSPRIGALGDVDELNSTLGVLLAELPHSHTLIKLLQPVQNQLFDLGSELAVADPDFQALSESSITQLESWLDQLNAQLPPLQEFILPGGNRCAALCHLARSVCRRAERSLHLLSDTETGSPLGARYLNRLSDLLFVMARALAREQGDTEVLWQPQQPTAN